MRVYDFQISFFPSTSTLATLANNNFNQNDPESKDETMEDILDKSLDRYLSAPFPPLLMLGTYLNARHIDGFSSKNRHIKIEKILSAVSTTHR